jgi:hypothetical protein
MKRLKNLAGLSGVWVVVVQDEGISDEMGDVITVCLQENRMSFKKGDLLDVYQYELEEMDNADGK